jgi:beta-lactam-binding protein with PASTA domain
MRQGMIQMTRRVLAVAAVAAIAVGAPASAIGHARGAAAASPATVAYSFPEQCVVLPVEKTPFAKARALLARLGCRVRRTEQTSGIAKGLVVAVVGGERSYAFGHTVTLIVSSGPT